MILWQLFTCEPLYGDVEYVRDWLPIVLDHVSKLTPLQSRYHTMEGLAFQIWRNGVRPKIPANCITSLKKLMQECWHYDHTRRPSFERINRKIDQILIQIAIPDDQARRFWKKYFFRQVCVPSISTAYATGSPRPLDVAARRAMGFVRAIVLPLHS